MKHVVHSIKILTVASSVLFTVPASAWGDREQGALLGLAAGIFLSQSNQYQTNRVVPPSNNTKFDSVPPSYHHRHNYNNYNHPNIYRYGPSVYQGGSVCREVLVSDQWGNSVNRYYDCR